MRILTIVYFLQTWPLIHSFRIQPTNGTQKNITLKLENQAKIFSKPHVRETTIRSKKIKRVAKNRPFRTVDNIPQYEPPFYLDQNPEATSQRQPQSFNLPNYGERSFMVTEDPNQLLNTNLKPQFPVYLNPVIQSSETYPPEWNQNHPESSATQTEIHYPDSILTQQPEAKSSPNVITSDINFPDYNAQPNLPQYQAPVYIAPHRNPAAYEDSAFIDKSVSRAIIEDSPKSITPKRPKSELDPIQYSENYHQPIQVPVYVDKLAEPSIHRPILNSPKTVETTRETTEPNYVLDGGDPHVMEIGKDIHYFEDPSKSKKGAITTENEDIYDETDEAYAVSLPTGKLFMTSTIDDGEDDVSEKTHVPFEEFFENLRRNNEPDDVNPQPRADTNSNKVIEDARDTKDFRDDYWNRKPIKPMNEMEPDGQEGSNLWKFPGYYKQKRERGGWIWGGYGWWGGISEFGDFELPSIGILGAFVGLFGDFSFGDFSLSLRVPKNLVTLITIPTFIALTITAILIFTCTHMNNCCWGACNEPPLCEEYMDQMRRKEEKCRCENYLARKGQIPIVDISQIHRTSADRDTVIVQPRQASREDRKRSQDPPGSEEEPRGSKEEPRGSKEKTRGSKEEPRGSKEKSRGSQDPRGSKGTEKELKNVSPLGSVKNESKVSFKEGETKPPPK